MADNQNNQNNQNSQSNQNNQNGSQGGGLTKGKDVLDPAKQSKGAEVASKVAKEAVKKVATSLAKLIVSHPIISLIVLLVLCIIGWIYLFCTAIPGLALEQIKAFAQGVWDSVQSWFTTTASAYINDSDIIDLAAYIEELDYDLIGDGFVVPTSNSTTDYPTYEELIEAGYEYGITEFDGNEDGEAESAYRYYKDSEDNIYGVNGNGVPDDNGDIQEYEGLYYNSLGVLINNKTGTVTASGTTGATDYYSDTDYYLDKYGFWRSTEDLTTNGQGKIIGFESNVNTDLLKTYLLSDYRIYVIKNNDEGILKSIFEGLATLFGGNKWGWSKGLLMFWQSEGGWATNKFSFWDELSGDTIEIVSKSKLKIKNGYFNNPIIFNIDGWADRYGMSLEFLLSLHLATGAPDLVYAMLQSFDTEVQVYLDDSGDSTVMAGYVDFLDEDSTVEDNIITYNDIKNTLDAGGYDFASNFLNPDDLTTWVNELVINEENAQYLLLNLPLNSLWDGPLACYGGSQGYVIEASTDASSYFLGIDFSDSCLEEDYGIVEGCDPDVYDEVSLENVSYKDEGEVKSGFTLDHIAYSTVKDGTDEELTEAKAEINVYDTTACKLYNDACALGYDPTDESITTTIDATELGGKSFYTSEECEEVTGYTLSSTVADATPDNAPFVCQSKSYVDTYNELYYVRRVKTETTWTKSYTYNGVSEEVEYNWISYRYIIYQIGTYEKSTSSGAGSNQHTYYHHVSSISWFTGQHDEENLDAIMDQVYECGGHNYYGKFKDIVFVEYITREKTYQELADEGCVTEAGTIELKNSVCSAQSWESRSKCCKHCLQYVKDVIRAICTTTDNDYKAYTPYIARVLGSWFRDTYFVIPKKADDAIKDYAGNER